MVEEGFKCFSISLVEHRGATCTIELKTYNETHEFLSRYVETHGIKQYSER